MRALPLTRSQERAFERALRASTRCIDIKLRLLNKEGKGLPARLVLLDGEVVVDDTNPEEPTYKASLQIADLDGYFRLSRTMRHDGQNWFSKKIRVIYRIWVEDLNGDSGDWVDCPLITGPIFDVQRSGKVIDVAIVGEEINFIGPARFPRTFHVKRHTKVHKAIKGVVRFLDEIRGTSTPLRLVKVNKRIAKSRTMPRGSSPWKWMQNFADVVDKMLYFDAAGVLVMKRKPRRPVARLSDGLESTVAEHPTEKISRARLINMIIVRTGGRRKRKDDQPRPVVVFSRLKRSHPMSRESIGVDLIEVKEFDKLKSREEAKSRGDDILERKGGRLDHELEFSTFIDPRREPGDILKADVGAIHKRVRVHKYQLGLGLESTMDHNWAGRLRPQARRAHRKKRRHRR